MCACIPSHWIAGMLYVAAGHGVASTRVACMSVMSGRNVKSSDHCSWLDNLMAQDCHAVQVGLGTAAIDSSEQQLADHSAISLMEEEAGADLIWALSWDPF